MQDIIKINRDESSQPRVPNTVLQRQIESIKLQANRGETKKDYKMTCTESGINASYDNGSNAYSLDISWEFLTKVKDLFK